MGSVTRARGRPRLGPGIDLDMGRYCASMFASGSALVIAASMPSWSSATSRPVIGVVVGAAIVAAVVLALWGRHLPVEAFEPFTAIGAVMVTIVALEGGAGVLAYLPMYAWVSVYACTFYSIRGVVLQVLVIAACLAMVVHLRPGAGDPAVVWIIELGVVVVTGVWVRSLVGRLQRQHARLGDAVTERTRLEVQLRHQAYHDQLTGLGNRILFMERVREMLDRQRSDGSVGAVLLLDLDHFKTVNDSLGHAAGDSLLRAVGGRISACVRPGDVTARLGGDEFAVLLEHLVSEDAALEVAHRILGELRRPVAVDGRELSVGASIGVALSHEGGAESPESLLRDADLAMYAAKEQGRNRCRIYDDSMDTEMRERLTLEQELRAAVAAGALDVVYQPQIELTTGRMVGVEALVRWMRGNVLMPPDAFIPLAEETGLIAALDDIVLRTACRVVQQWTVRAGMPLRLAVNISGSELEWSGLVGRVSAALAETGLDPRQLELELTETVAVHQSREALEQLAELRRLGVAVAIDDFGTGYSMLSRLQNFPVDRVKIDRSFLSRVSRPTDDAPIVAAMVTMSHGLGLQVTGEGVESAEQLAFLRRHGCDEAQGFHIGTPLTAAELRGLIGGSERSADAVDRELLEAFGSVASWEAGPADLTRALLSELCRVLGLDAAAVVVRAADGLVRLEDAAGMSAPALLAAAGAAPRRREPGDLLTALGLAHHRGAAITTAAGDARWVFAGNRTERGLPPDLERRLDTVARLLSGVDERPALLPAPFPEKPGRELPVLPAVVAPLR